MGARLTLPQIRAALEAGGRNATSIRSPAASKRASELLTSAHPRPVADAFGATVGALVSIIAEANRQIADLEATLETRFEQHPDAVIYHSQPGLGTVLGARALGEFEVRPPPLHQRQVTQELRRHVAHHSGVRPQTRRGRPPRPKSGVSPTPWTNRWFCSLTPSPGAPAFYDQKRAAGDLHHQALRALANRLVGILHGCLKHQTPHNEHTAWAHRTTIDQAAA